MLRASKVGQRLALDNPAPAPATPLPLPARSFNVHALPMGQPPGRSVARPMKRPEGAGAKIRGSMRAAGGEARGQGANPTQDGGGSGSGSA